MSAVVSRRILQRDSACDDFLTVLGCTVSVVGLLCLFGQALSPWTLLGSVSYATVGPTLLLYSCSKFRHNAISCLPVFVQELLLNG